MDDGWSSSLVGCGRGRFMEDGLLRTSTATMCDADHGSTEELPSWL
jgi:hypothetical protein